MRRSCAGRALSLATLAARLLATATIAASSVTHTAVIYTAIIHTAPAHAHHSTAMFEPEKRATLTGKVKDFQWTNPHAWIQVTITGDDGQSTDWSFECGSPNTLSRQGWKPSTLKAGDPVTVVANPMKDGTSAGLMYTVTLADGRVLGPGAAAQPSAQPSAAPAAR